MNDIVFRNANGSPVTNSLLVAETFGKAHRNVLRDIENLECSESFQVLNFEQMFKIRELPNGGQAQDRYYNITKDGFTILAMGYTGKKAMEFKEKYIAAFNAMQRTIEHGTITSEQLMSTCMQTQQVLTQQMLLLSQQMESVMKVNTLMLDRIATLEGYTIANLEKGKRQRKMKVRASSPGYITVPDAVNELKTRGVILRSQALYKYLRTMNYTSSNESCYNRPNKEWLDGGWMSFCSSGTRQVGDNPNIRRRYFTPLLGMAFIDRLETELRKHYDKNTNEAQLAFGFGKEVQL